MVQPERKESAMRPQSAWTFPVLAALVTTFAVVGCATTRSGEGRHPGVVEKNPNATIRTYPASATRVAWALTDVMKKDAILEEVSLMIDPQSRDSRPLSHAEKQALGLSGIKSMQRDMNYNITAKSKDGQRVGVLVLLKGESSAEVSMLYGAVGDAALSKILLDEVEVVMAGPLKDPGLAQASVAKLTSKRSNDR